MDKESDTNTSQIPEKSILGGSKELKPTENTSLLTSLPSIANKTINNSIKKPRRLTLKQQMFISEYIKNKGNGTKSALSVYNTSDPATANDIAQDNLRNPLVLSEINSKLYQLGITDEFRLNNIKSVLDGKYISEVEITDKEGKVKSRIRSTPKANDIIKANELINKMTGLYQKNKAVGNAMSDGLRRLTKQYVDEVKQSIKQKELIDVEKIQTSLKQQAQ